MADLHNDILHVQINSRTLNICSKTPAGAKHILSSLVSFKEKSKYIYLCILIMSHTILVKYRDQRVMQTSLNYLDVFRCMQY